MDKIIRYRQLIQDLLIHYGELINRRPKPDKETEVIFDEEYMRPILERRAQNRVPDL